LWDTNKQQLLAAIIQVHDVKVTGAKLNDVAVLMGPGKQSPDQHQHLELLQRHLLGFRLTLRTECTAKALTHRLAKIRNVAKGDTTADASAQETRNDGKSTKAKTAKTSGGGSGGGRKKGAGGGKKRAARTPSPTGDDEEQLGNGAPTPPPSNRPNRAGAKRDYATLAGENSDDKEGDGLDKKVKIEVGEDIGEGLRQSNEEEQEDDDMDGAGFLT